MTSFLRIPKVQLIVTLFLIFITTLITFPNSTTLYLLFVCVGFTTCFDLIFTLVRKRVFFIPYAAIATGLIFTLIIDPTANWFQIAITSAIAMGFKNFIRVSGRHIFNPAASGLFLSGLLLGHYMAAWWGVSFQILNQLNLKSITFFLILLSPGIISAIRLKKYYSIFAFMITTLGASQVVSLDLSFNGLFGVLLTPAFLFFTLVMLPEPMTSPVNYRMQILYGILVALVSFAFSLPFINELLKITNLVIDPLLFALLIGNLVFFKNR